MIGWRMATRLLGVISTLTLVRLLLPTDFGLVALSTSFQQSIEAFVVLGVEDAVVREKAPTRDIYDTGFTLNALRSVLTSTIVLLLAFPAGRFFAEPRLSNILIALAAGTLIEGFTNIGIVDFRRDFTFSKEFQLWLLPRMIGIVLTLASAFIWRSYWALVVGILASRILRVRSATTCIHTGRGSRSGLAAADRLLDLDLGAQRGGADARSQRLHPDRPDAGPHAGRHLLHRRRGGGAADDGTGRAVLPRGVLGLRRGPQCRPDAGRDLSAADRNDVAADLAGDGRDRADCRSAGEPGLRAAVGRGGSAGADPGAGGQ